MDRKQDKISIDNNNTIIENKSPNINETVIHLLYLDISPQNEEKEIKNSFEDKSLTDRKDYKSEKRYYKQQYLSGNKENHL